MAKQNIFAKGAGHRSQQTARRANHHTAARAPLVSRTRYGALRAAPQSRDPQQSERRDGLRISSAPPCASKTRVTALMALRSIQRTSATRGADEPAAIANRKSLSGHAAPGLEPLGDFGQHADRGLA